MCNRTPQPRKQNAAVINLLKRNSCHCITQPILDPDCKIHNNPAQNQGQNIMDAEIPQYEAHQLNVPNMCPQNQIFPDFAPDSGMKGAYYQTQNLAAPSKEMEISRPNGAIPSKPLVKFLRKNVCNEIPMKEINNDILDSDDIESVDSDTVYDNLPLLEQL